MLRTRVGYAGGTTSSPTYQSIGDHSEALQIDFDPELISYEELLAEFFSSHNPCRVAFSQQYRSAIFPHGEAQARAAEEASRRAAVERGSQVVTDIEPFTGFTLAEDYHQKYRLRFDKALMAAFGEVYPTMEELLGSTAVTRANAFIAGHGDERLIAEDLPRMGLTPELQGRLR